MGQKQYFLLYYNQDDGECFVEDSPGERKTEINPIGYFVRFYNTLAEAKRIKARIDRFPYLAAKYLNIV